jgi:hypothetical protein
MDSVIENIEFLARSTNRVETLEMFEETGQGKKASYTKPSKQTGRR